MRTYKVEVKYNSFFGESEEMGDLTCEMFDLFEFTEHATACVKLVGQQMKHDPQYRDVHEARVTLWIDGERIARQNFRREANGIKMWRNSPTQIGSVIEYV